MSAGAGRWDDLLARLGSAAVMAGVGLGAMWAGGWAFLVLVAVCVGLMIWELSSMLAPVHRRSALGVAVLAAAAVVLARLIPLGLALPFLLLPGIIAMARFEGNRRLFSIYAALIALSGIGLVVLREDFGFVWLLWLVVLVIVTDVAGYFAGRLIGGPKFWPKVSPKKTWSGTVAGWIGAAVVAMLFMKHTGSGIELIGISVALSMASQLGDISESAVKRKVGVKDSSSLIPGHGGLLDRFDGMLAASVVLLLIEQIVDFPPVPGVSG